MLACPLAFFAACNGTIGDSGFGSDTDDDASAASAGAGGDAGGPATSVGSSSHQGGGSSTGASSGAGNGPQGSGGQAGGQPGYGADGVFLAPNPWTKSVEGMTPHPTSKAITSWLEANGGWGTGTFRIDFGMEVLAADESTPFKTFEPTDEFYSPDCDHVPMPMPAGGAIEGESGYSCDSDGDCHLIVVHKPTNTLYEMWRANLVGGTLYGGCAVTWDLTHSYGETLRGEGCTSADGGGFPITPMLFTADEVAAGEIKHAIRFILPNARIRKMVYVHPGTHTSFNTSGGADAPPYGVRLRLRADFPLESLPTEGARVVARGLQKYGMFLADGGNIALTGRSDRFTQNKWGDVGVDAYSLSAIEVTDMEVVDMGEPITWDESCSRNSL